MSNRLFQTCSSICSFQKNFTSSSSIERSMFFSDQCGSRRSMQVRSCSSSENSSLEMMSVVSSRVRSSVLVESSERYSVSSRIIFENSFCCSGVRFPL